MPTLFKTNGPGLITIDGRNKDNKRELYISDIPTDRNTIVFRLQNAHTEAINLEEGFKVVFPKGLFDENAQLKPVNCQISKWKTQHGDLINTNNLQNEVKTTVEQFQRLQFADIDDVIQLPPTETLGESSTLDDDIKQLIGKYVEESLGIKRKIKSLFEDYFKNQTPQVLGNLNIVSDLYNNLTELSEQIEANIFALVSLKSNFQDQRSKINTLVSETVRDTIIAQIKGLSGKKIFKDPENPDGAIHALTQLGEILNKLTLNPNLVNLLSEHDRESDSDENSDWKIETEFVNNQQSIKITATQQPDLLILKPKEYFVVEISNFEVSREADVQNGNILLDYTGAKINNSGNAFNNQFSQTVAFSIIKRVGKLLPLYIELDQYSRLINDGETVNELLFRLTNIGLKEIKIPYDSIEIRFDLQQQDGIYPKAFIEGDRLSNVVINLTDANNSVNENATINETQTKNARINWNNSNTYDVKPNAQFLIKFKNITTNLPSGNIPITFLFRNIDGYKDRFYDLKINRALAKVFYRNIKLDGFTKNGNVYEKLLLNIPKSKEYYLAEYNTEGERKPAKLSVKPFGTIWKIIVETTKPIEEIKDSTLNIRFTHYSMTNKTVRKNPYELIAIKSKQVPSNILANAICLFHSDRESYDINESISYKFQFLNKADYDYFNEIVNPEGHYRDSATPKRFRFGTKNPNHFFIEGKLHNNQFHLFNLYLYQQNDAYVVRKNFYIGFEKKKACNRNIYASLTLNFNRTVGDYPIIYNNPQILILEKDT